MEGGTKLELEKTPPRLGQAVSRIESNLATSVPLACNLQCKRYLNEAACTLPVVACTPLLPQDTRERERERERETETETETERQRETERETERGYMKQ